MWPAIRRARSLDSLNGAASHFVANRRGAIFASGVQLLPGKADVRRDRYLSIVIIATATAPDGQQIFRSLVAAIPPYLLGLLALLTLGLLLAAPIPGRGPGWPARRDPWRVFRFDARRQVLARAGGRCEAATFLIWRRCPGEASEADHIYPWSKGGATVICNGQALCSPHNKAKSNRTPPWWYLLGLERRRRNYFPSGSDVRVRAAMSSADRAARNG